MFERSFFKKNLSCTFLDSYYEYLFKAGILFGDKLSLARFSEVQNSYENLYDA